MFATYFLYSFLLLVPSVRGYATKKYWHVRGIILGLQQSCDQIITIQWILDRIDDLSRNNLAKNQVSAVYFIRELFAEVCPPKL